MRGLAFDSVRLLLSLAPPSSSPPLGASFAPHFNRMTPPLLLALTSASHNGSAANRDAVLLLPATFHWDPRRLRNGSSNQYRRLQALFLWDAIKINKLINQLTITMQSSGRTHHITTACH